MAEGGIYNSTRPSSSISPSTTPSNLRDKKRERDVLIKVWRETDRVARAVVVDEKAATSSNIGSNLAVYVYRVYAHTHLLSDGRYTARSNTLIQKQRHIESLVFNEHTWTVRQPVRRKKASLLPS